MTASLRLASLLLRCAPALLACALTAHAQLIQIDGVVTSPAATGPFAYAVTGTSVRLQFDITPPLSLIAIDAPQFADYRVPATFSIAGVAIPTIPSLVVVLENNYLGRSGIVAQYVNQVNPLLDFVTFQSLSTLPLVTDVGTIPTSLPLAQLTAGTDENIGFFGNSLVHGAIAVWVATSYREIPLAAVPEPSTYGTAAGLLLIAAVGLGRIRARRVHAPRGLPVAS